MITVYSQLLNLIQVLSKFVLIIIMAECSEDYMIDWGRNNGGWGLLNTMV